MPDEEFEYICPHCGQEERLIAFVQIWTELNAEGTDHYSDATKNRGDVEYDDTVRAACPECEEWEGRLWMASKERWAEGAQVIAKKTVRYNRKGLTAGKIHRGETVTIASRDGRKLQFDEHPELHGPFDISLFNPIPDGRKK